jgi:hypothetical protein
MKLDNNSKYTESVAQLISITSILLPSASTFSFQDGSAVAAGGDDDGLATGADSGDSSHVPHCQ